MPPMLMPMDKVALGNKLAEQHIKSRSRTTYSSVDDASDEVSEDHRPSVPAPKTDAYATRELCRNVMGAPHWDGKSL